MEKSYKLIDEKWIDRCIEVFEDQNKVLEKGTRNIYKAKKEIFELIKKQLQSPIDIVREAYIKGWENRDGEDKIEDWSKDEEIMWKYLKEKGYE